MADILTNEVAHIKAEDNRIHRESDEKSFEESVKPLEMYAEGRWRAWSTVFGAWLIQFCAVGIVSSFGVLQEFYTTTWLPDSSASSISWIGSIQIGLEYFMSPLGGELMDRGHFRAITWSGCVLFVFSLFMSSLAGNKFYQILLSQGIGMGLGVGLLFLPTAVVPIRHFREGHAFVIGLVDSSISVGGLAFSIGLNYLIQGSLGFHWGIRVAAFITLGCFILGCAMMTYPKKRFDEGAAIVHPSWKRVLKGAGKDWPYLLAILQGFVMSLGTFVPPFYVQLFAQMHGSSKTTSFYALAVLNFTGMFGRVIPNYLADRFGVLNIYIPCLTIGGALCFAMLGATTPEGLFLFAVFYGFFFGATNGMYLPLINEVSISSGNGNHLWKRCGLSLIPPGIAALIGPPIAGQIVGPNYIWWQGILFASLTMLAAVGLVILSRHLMMKAKEAPNSMSK
ncbi:MFS general substrate transporter [Moniliophthora roreri MCA 2997]|uniref:MFS general substrate transporter n=2 Tax=Moniliophthora roreri TaxID=221103 RepID=V2WUC7_MONRO|nr:MFS general substrate transporter [Moniliophthora roreri MCA 2997]KAI3608012.1 MFS general substrate transporter [Moniliophthora roreri]